MIVVSQEISRKYSLEQLLDFVLRDNDIRPSCLVVVSDEKAIDALHSNDPSEIPAFYLTGLVKNSYLSNKIMPAVSLAKLDATMQSGKSFLLQNVISYKGEHKFSGAGIFHSKTKRLIGTLSQVDLEGLSWIQDRPKGGVIKHMRNEPGVRWFMKLSIRKGIIPTVHGDDISFHVKVESEGWFMEDWTVPEVSGDEEYIHKLENDFKNC